MVRVGWKVFGMGGRRGSERGVVGWDERVDRMRDGMGVDGVREGLGEGWRVFVRIE